MAGAASALAFQPFGAWPLMIVAIAALCHLVDDAVTLRRAMLVGWLFGLGQFVVGLNWIATAFTFQAAMPAWLGWIAVVLLSLYLAVYPMLASGLAWRFGKSSPVALVLTMAGAWTITEWLRATMFTGFAWNPLGVVFADTPWRETSIYIGTYGLGTLVVLAGGALWLAFRRDWRPGVAIVLPLALLPLLPTSIVPDQPGLMTFDAAEPPVPPSMPSQSRFDPPPPKPVLATDAISTGHIRVIQPNIGQEDKWRDGFDAIAARRLSDLSRKALPSNSIPSETIFWPEAAVTNPLLDERGAAASLVASERLRAVANLVPGQLLATGGLALLSSDRMSVDGATNSVFVLNAAGQIVGRYDKSHLVPYGEYLPMRPILSAIGLSRLAPGDLDFRPGPGPQTLTLPNGRRMGVQICYEIIFSGEVIDRSDRPDYLFNPSNDAWFGAWGPPQHLAQARLRATEEGVPVIRSTPTGISAVVDARGRILSTVGAREAGVIDSGLPLAAAPTPFSRFGNLIPLALAFLLLLTGIALGRRRGYSAAI